MLFRREATLQPGGLRLPRERGLVASAMMVRCTSLEVPPIADLGQLAHSLDFASYGATGGGTHLDALWIPGLRPAFLPNLPVHSPDELRLALQLLLRGIANENGTVVSRGCAVLEDEEPSTSDPRGKIHATGTWVFCWSRLAGRAHGHRSPRR